MTRRWLVSAGVIGATAVALGAFGAHALDTVFETAADGARRRAWWDTAAHYHLLHAPAVAIAGLLGARRAAGRWAGASAAMLVVGVAVFSGTLYAMALGAPRWLGAVTPLGGTLLIFGWTAMAVAAARGGGAGTPAPGAGQ